MICLHCKRDDVRANDPWVPVAYLGKQQGWAHQSCERAWKEQQPQTVQVTLGPQPDHPFWENPPPTLVPNPVRVVLQPVPKPAARHSNKTQK
jgi:hypothetical protein